jgi:hypothetical protein
LRFGSDASQHGSRILSTHPLSLALIDDKTITSYEALKEKTAILAKEA